MISIVIPAYNVKAYIDRCLDSVVNQTYRDLEVILVDDGSTDGTSKVCDIRGQQDSRITVVHQENGGLSAARNTGLNYCHGEYVFFLDSDDYLEENAMEIMLKKAEETEADIVCCGIRKVYDRQAAESFTRDCNLELNSVEAVREMMVSNTVCSTAWNKLYRRSLWKDMFYPLGKKHEDEFITYKLLYAANRVIYIGREFYQYYQRSDSIMGNIIQEGNLSDIEAMEERSRWLLERKEYELYAVSNLKTLERIKYLYRRFKGNGGKYDNEFSKLMGSYKKISKEIFKDKNVKFIDKCKTLYWQYMLPIGK